MKKYEARVDPDRPGWWLIDIRKHLGLRQQDFHRGGFASQVSLWETGARTPSIDSLLKIAEAHDLELWIGFRERVD